MHVPFKITWNVDTMERDDKQGKLRAGRVAGAGCGVETLVTRSRNRHELGPS